MKEIDLTIPYPVEITAILCHKPFTDNFQDVSNRIFLSDNNTPGTIPYETFYDSRVFGELGAWRWLATQIRDCDRASLWHYRRRLPFTLSPVAVPTPIQLPCSLLEQMAFYHSPKVADAMLKVLPQNESDVLRCNVLYPYNIMKLPRRLIWEYINFVEPRLLQIMSVLGCPLDYNGALEYMKNDQSFTDPKDGKNTDPTYQCRIGGFILERLTTIFILQLKNVQKEHLPIKLLETNQMI